MTSTEQTTQHLLMTAVAQSVQRKSESRSVGSDSLQPHGLYSLWTSPGQNAEGGSRSLLQGIFPIQGLNPGLLNCRWIPEPPGKPKNTGVDSLFLLQGLSPTQKSKQGLLHCRWILYQLSYQNTVLIVIVITVILFHSQGL